MQSLTYLGPKSYLSTDVLLVAQVAVKVAVKRVCKCFQNQGLNAIAGYVLINRVMGLCPQRFPEPLLGQDPAPSQNPRGGVLIPRGMGNAVSKQGQPKRGWTEGTAAPPGALPPRMCYNY